ncbi:hypothetical protein BDV27DRAFT_140990 [Aspergillus caelatus]|uniref:SMP-30/Gluconolactonase/LRE-like region domain-containing protein n=1 Tax=Aspergillus caelatus TaxID=61420 RepID=A0A5N7AII9_9EURO|nr:uncharacterized protein BDV27DRAFT_140990 [Aspergillus caelatus]KAE8369691.1 hypothetical protein BDV27DRAFT_140990 [Aspergillus caelatus]
MPEFGVGVLLPAIVQAVEWTTLPHEFRRPGFSEHSINQKRGKPLDSFLEGPIYVSSLDLLFVTDIPCGRIFSIDSNANWTLVTEYDGEPNGLVWNHITKKIGIADFKQGILEDDPISKELKTIVARFQGERLNGPNDLVISADGVIYFTDQGMTGLQDPTSRVFRLYPDGRLQLLISNGPSPNRLVLSRDEKALFVAMTRDNAVWYVPLLSDGSYGIGGPDGMAQDADGNILVAHSTLGLFMKIKSPRGAHTTNLTWGGPSMNVLYIVESETAAILRVDWHCQGWLMKLDKEENFWTK